MKKFVFNILKVCPEVQVFENYNLINNHTYHIECRAKIYIKVTNSKDAVKLLNYFKEKRIKYILLGAGSNTIFKQKLVTKVVVHFCGGSIKNLSNNCLQVFAGVTIAELLKHCTLNNFSGIEWSAGIPASVGGAVVMNMGAFNENISKYIASVTYFLDGKVVTKKVKNQDFCYRGSFFKNIKCVVLGVKIKLKKSNKEAIIQNIKKFLNLKHKIQPVSEYSCGCVFKNLKDLKVAKLIEDCNLKGYTKGGAQISTMHSNFIINKNNATFQDVFHIIRHIKKVVQKRYNVCIFCEVVIQ